MDWVTGLIKYVTASNRLILSIFITAIVLIVGPSYLPFIKPVQEDWQWVPVAVAIFSGAMLVFSALTYIWGTVARLPKVIAAALPSKKPEGFELELLKYLVHNYGEDCLNLDRLDYTALSRLDVLAARDSLVEMGFIDVNWMSSNLITVTKEGREYLTKLSKK